VTQSKMVPIQRRIVATRVIQVVWPYVTWKLLERFSTFFLVTVITTMSIMNAMVERMAARRPTQTPKMADSLDCFQENHITERRARKVMPQAMGFRTRAKVRLLLTASSSPWR
jgi:hypothetical protein